MNYDDEEGSKIKCGLDSLDGKFHVNIHVSSMSNGTNDRGPCGNEVEKVDEGLEALGGHNF